MLSDQQKHSKGQEFFYLLWPGDISVPITALTQEEMWCNFTPPKNGVIALLASLAHWGHLLEGSH